MVWVLAFWAQGVQVSFWFIGVSRHPRPPINPKPLGSIIGFMGGGCRLWVGPGFGYSTGFWGLRGVWDFGFRANLSRVFQFRALRFAVLHADTSHIQA